MGEELEDHYTYRLEWSAERYTYFARCLEVTGFCVTAPTANEALVLAQAQVQQYLQESKDFGADPPTPLGEYKFSGRFMVRTSRELHARMMTEATEQRVSLNQWVVQKLVARPPSLDW